MAANLAKFRVTFLFILKMVYCVYSLESPHRGDSNENTQHTYLHVKENGKYIPIMPPDLAGPRSAIGRAADS